MAVTTFPSGLFKSTTISGSRRFNRAAIFRGPGGVYVYPGDGTRKAVTAAEMAFSFVEIRYSPVVFPELSQVRILAATSARARAREGVHVLSAIVRRGAVRFPIARASIRPNGRHCARCRLRQGGGPIYSPSRRQTETA